MHSSSSTRPRLRNRYRSRAPKHATIVLGLLASKLAIADTFTKVDASGPVADTSTGFLSDLEWIWDTCQTQLYDSTLVARFFTESNRSLLMERARTARSTDDLAKAVNALLDSLNLSHTRLFTESDAEYSMFQSMFVTKNISTPPVHHLGFQCVPVSQSYVIRAVWDGYPAARAGLQRGDIILAANGEHFEPLNSLRSGRATQLTLRRGDDTLRVEIEPVLEGIDASLRQAMRNSVRKTTLNGSQVGYVHLWSGTCPEILSAFTHIITEEFRDVDGVLLDLRDGWGGAWYDYLDPFFEDRSDYFVSTVVRRGRQIVTHPTSVGPHAWFKGPLVVLINEGTRSGKEAMAFQFKKSRRGVLVGTTSAGAFTGGATYFRSGFVLFLPYNGSILLDGQRIEGVGVTPDIPVARTLDLRENEDAQFERGLAELCYALVKKK